MGALPAGMTMYGLMLVLAADILEKLQIANYQMVLHADGVSLRVNHQDRGVPVFIYKTASPTADGVNDSIKLWNSMSQDERHSLFLEYWPVEATMDILTRMSVAGIPRTSPPEMLN